MRRRLQEVLKPNPTDPTRPYTDTVLVYPAVWTMEEARVFVEDNVAHAFVFAKSRGRDHVPLPTPTAPSREVNVILNRERVQDKRPIFALFRSFLPRLMEGALVRFRVRIFGTAERGWVGEEGKCSLGWGRGGGSIIIK